MNVHQAFSEWTAYRGKMFTLGLVAGSTYRNQGAIADHLAIRLGGHSLDTLRKSHIELWMGERLQTCSPVTVRGELNVLRQILRWCQDEGHLATLPRLPKLSVPSVEDALPSDEAFAWVLANVPERHSAALEFMMLTGLSPHEIERVQAQDIRVGKNAEGFCNLLAIGERADFAVKQESRRRRVPLNTRASLIWHQYATVLDNRTGHPFPTVGAMQKAIQRAVHGSAITELLYNHPPGAQHITPKLMRKWFASKVSNDQPEHVLQRLMGHAPGSPITRRHYVRSTDEQQAAAVEGVTLR